MLDCFKNLIGIKGCGAPVPESGLYVNELAGITLASIEAISNKEQVTYLGTWADIEARAIRKFEVDFTAQFNRQYQAYCCRPDCSITDLICTIQDSLLNAFLYLLGAELMIERIFSERINWFTTVSLDEARELKDFYQVEYEATLKIALNAIPKEVLEDCYVCVGSRISRIETLP